VLVIDARLPLPPPLQCLNVVVGVGLFVVGINTP